MRKVGMMKNKISCIVIMLLVLINLVSGGVKEASAAVYITVESKAKGDIITFADRQWIILEPANGLIILRDNDGNRVWHSEQYGNYEFSSIRAYLNGEFLNKLGDENKSVIRDWTWNCGPEIDEDRESVTDKVGLLTRNEYFKHYSQYVPQSFNWWLMTICLNGKAFYAPNLYTSALNVSDIGVRPCLHFKPGTLINRFTNEVVGVEEAKIPDVDTFSLVEGLTATTAEVGGAVISDGGDASTERGIVYATHVDPITSDNKVTDVGKGTGTFTATLKDLKPGTTYYFSAYATNAYVTYYGKSISFTTSKLNNLTLNGVVIPNLTVGEAGYDLTKLNLAGSDQYGNPYDITGQSIIWTVTSGGEYARLNGEGTATSVQLFHPGGVATDSSGNVYIADCENHRIRKVDMNGMISTVAGNGSGGYSGDGGMATSAQLFCPYGVAIDSSGNLYIADYGNHRIRKVDANGMISTVAGNGSGGYSGDGGVATSAQLWFPERVAIDSSDNIYIVDSINHRIRKVDANGMISTVAGNGSGGYSGDGGAAVSAQLFYPEGVAIDSRGNVYIADSENHRIRKVDTNGMISTVAGNGSGGYSGDGGSATSAQLNHPYDVATDSSNNLYIADGFNNRIRKVDTNGNISTVAGDGSEGYLGDGGAATFAQLQVPYGVAIDSSGNLYIADCVNNRIRKVDLSGNIDTVAGTGIKGSGGGNILDPVSAGLGTVTAAINDFISEPVSFTVDAAGGAVTINTCRLPAGIINKSYSGSLQASGGTAPYTWDVTGLPAEFNTNIVGSTCEITGTLDGKWSDIVTVTVTDNKGASAIKTLSLIIDEKCGNGGYLVLPDTGLADAGFTPDGIRTMTVKDGISGFKYVSVNIHPVTGHSGDEVAVFVHLRDGVQVGFSANRADFDVTNNAQAAFNVRPGDIIKVYLVDSLSNDDNSNPTLL